jgi:hypothetical protein
MPLHCTIDYGLYADSFQQTVDDRYVIYPFDFRLEPFYVHVGHDQ